MADARTESVYAASTWQVGQPLKTLGPHGGKCAGFEAPPGKDMNIRHDHLIERAAARMRGKSPAGSVPPEVENAQGVASSESVFVPSVPPQHAPTDAAASQAPLRDPAGDTDDLRALPPGDTAVAIAATDGAPANLPSLPDTFAPDLDLKTLEEAGLVVGRSTRTRISEEFRIAVARIAQMAEVGTPDGTRNPVILVTSARPGEGKTFTTLNLAAVLAQNGPRRVVLVDTDFKQGSLSDLLKLSTCRGLFDLMDGAVSDPRTLTLTTEVRGLSVLPSGTYLTEAVGTGFSGPLGAKVAAVAAAFPDALVVLDAPPCLSTSDPSTLAAVAGQVLLVVEAGRTQRSEVEAALDFVRACPNITLLLNKVRQTNRRTFGSYDYLSSYQ